MYISKRDNFKEYPINLFVEGSKMIYRINKKEKRIKIFGKNFVNNNSDKCIILYKNKIFSLKEHFPTIDIDKKDDKLEIFLVELDDLYDRRYIFDNCNFLEYIPLFEAIKYDSNDSKEFAIENSSYLEDSLKYYDLIMDDKNSDLQKDLISSSSKDSIYISNNYTIPCLLDITKWKTSFCCDMSYMFNDCQLLKSLPDISRWNTQNVTSMSNMFRLCKSLLSLPDISKWNMSKVKNVSYMFQGCSKLKFLPDISKWNTSNINNMSFIFSECSSLISLPDISKWNTNNLNNSATCLSNVNY